MTEDPFLTVEEAAALLKWEPETLRKKLDKGVFKLGVHYYKRDREIGIRFDRAALISWVKDPQAQRRRKGIPMSRGYVLGTGDDQ